MKRGDLIELPDEAPDYLPMIHKGGRYTVNKVEDAGGGAVYVTILGDDNEGHALLADMFRIVRGNARS